MLLGSVCADAVAPNLQERLLRRHAQPRAAVVLNTNALSAVLTALPWFATGEYRGAIAWLAANPKGRAALALQSLAGYAGVVAYLGCIKHAGSRVTVLVTTARKVLLFV